MDGSGYLRTGGFPGHRLAKDDGEHQADAQGNQVRDDVVEVAVVGGVTDGYAGQGSSPPRPSTRPSWTSCESKSTLALKTNSAITF